MGWTLPEPRPLGDRHNPREGRCVLIVGRLGAGKTSYAIKRALSTAADYRLPVYANAPIREDVSVLESWDHLARLPLDSEGRHPAVILLDEVHLWLPSMVGLMPKEQMQDAFELLSYARKRGWTVFATTQAPTRVHMGYRQLMTEMMRVRPLVQGRLHVAQMLDPDTYELVMGLAGVFNPSRGRYRTRAEVRPLWSVSRSPGGRPGRAEGPRAAPVQDWSSPPPFDGFAPMSESL